MSSINLWWKRLNGSMYLASLDTMKWNLEPFSRHYFSYMGYNRCLSIHYGLEYDEHYHLTSGVDLGGGRITKKKISCGYIINDYINKYDDRGRWYEYTVTQDAFIIDTLYHAKRTFIVDSFTYVVRPVNIEEFQIDKHTLLIVPNPGNETVRITATDSIATLNLYASDGRLAYTQEGNGKEMIVNLHGLSKSIYIVHARLKNGGVQTGKVVVN
jgi:hypothetical protein